MTQTILVAAVLAAAAPVVASPAGPALGTALRSTRDLGLGEKADRPRAALNSKLATASADARALARRAASLRLALSEPSGPAALDAWNEDLSGLARRTLSLSLAAQSDGAAAARALLADSQALEAAASALAGAAERLAEAPEAGARGAELARLAREGGERARQIRYDAQAILARQQ